MGDKSWKRRERQVAKYFGAERNALSGINAKITGADTLHKDLFIEVKERAKHTTVTLWDHTKQKALIEGKIPVVVLCEKGRQGFWVMAHCDDLDQVAMFAKEAKLR